MRHRLRIAREEAGLDQGDLADRMGVSRNTVSNTESGKSTPQRVVINAWALATGCPVNWLITGCAPPGPAPDGGDECPQQGSNLRPAD